MIGNFTLYVLFNNHLHYYERIEKIPSKTFNSVKIQIQLSPIYQKQSFDLADCSQFESLGI